MGHGSWFAAERDCPGGSEVAFPAKADHVLDSLSLLAKAQEETEAGLDSRPGRYPGWLDTAAKPLQN